MKWWQGLLAGAAAACAIEVLQLLLHKGLFEFDDIIHNSLGCMIGCLAGSLLIRKVRQHRERRADLIKKKIDNRSEK